MPSGSLAAGYMQTETSKEIGFWEKNGLRHGEFSLPDQSIKVVAIEFNVDSQLMAILCMSEDNSSMEI